MFACCMDIVFVIHQAYSPIQCFPGTPLQRIQRCMRTYKYSHHRYKVIFLLKSDESIHSLYVHTGGEATEYVVDLEKVDPLKVTRRVNV